MPTFSSAIIFILLRTFSVIFPPLPGLIFDLAGIVVFGKWLGFILAELGVMLGACLAFFIAKKYQKKLVKKFMPLSHLNKWTDRLSSRGQFLSLLLLRFSTSPFFDFINYAAGLTKIKFSIFFWASFLGSLPTMFLIYYFGDTAKQAGTGYFIGFSAALVLIAWLLSLKKSPK